GTVVGDAGEHFLRLFREVLPQSLHLRVVAPGGTYLELTDRSTPLRRWRTQEEPGAATPLGQRLERYEVPELWRSRGQYASLDGGATARPFEEVAGALLKGGKTVHFDLDDVLLVDDQFRPVKIRSAIPVTVFGGDFVVKRPQADEPQHSDVLIERPHLRGRDAVHFDMDDGGAPRLHALTRVIRRGRRFYDLDGSRTTQGEVIGVRRAVRDAHPKIGVLSKGVKGGFRHQVEFHLFGGLGVVDVDGVPHAVQVALVYASVRLLPHLGSNPSDTDLKAVHKGFADAAERWTGEPLSIPLAEGTPVGRQIYVVEEALQRATKFVFHFPTIDKGVGTIGAFLVTKRKEFRAHAGLGHLTLKIPEDVETTLDDGGSPMSTTAEEDGVRFDAVVVHHELGHIMGLPDEYLEDNEVKLPQFTQPLRSLLHSAQSESIMHGDFAPMLRHHWVLAQALERDGLLSEGGHVFCDTRRLDVGGGRTHRYQHRGTKSPYAELATFELGPKHGRHTAHIGVLGDDFDVLPGVSNIDGVVVLSPRLFVRFLGDDEGTVRKSVVTMRRDVHHRIVDAINAVGGAPRGTPPVLRRTSGGDVPGLPRRVVVSLQPRFSRVNIGAADLRVRVRRPTRQPGHAPFSARRSRVDIHIDQESTLVRHLLGLETERIPMLRTTGGGATLVFTVGSLTVTFEESSSASAGIDEYVSRLPNPAGGFTTLGGGDVATNLAAAINNPDNSLHGHLSATADGASVILNAPSGQLLDVRTAGTSIEFLPQFRTAIEHVELTSLAELVGAALGETFEVEL
ncbi:MAG: hypothetical protein KUG77_13075, partial [Nannocystaceae bacterium]|nr:hypothetical protein [Nannocystaceae bacterium]